jgi:membrane protein implicated in regulation of membrane protease activity
MQWFAIVIGTVFALLYAVFMTVFTGKMARRKRVKQPSYEELKKRRDALLFWFSFTAFWILVAAPRVNWSYFGEPWTGLFFSVCMMAVLYAARLVFNRRGRPKSDAQGSLGEQRP